MSYKQNTSDHKNHMNQLHKNHKERHDFKHSSTSFPLLAFEYSVYNSDLTLVCNNAEYI